MRGLLQKDLELARLNLKMWGIMFLIGIIYLLRGKEVDGGSFFAAYMMFVSVGLSTGTISYDTSDHGMQFLLTLPATRREYVHEKYLFCVGLTAVVGAVAMAISMLFYRVAAAELLLSAGIIFCCAVLCLALMLPLRLKYGDSGRILMAGLVVVIFMIILFCKEVLQKLKISGNTIETFFTRNTLGIGAGLVFVCLVCLLVSVKCSERVMERMEEF